MIYYDNIVLGGLLGVIMSAKPKKGCRSEFTKRVTSFFEIILVISCDRKLDQSQQALPSRTPQAHGAPYLGIRFPGTVCLTTTARMRRSYFEHIDIQSGFELYPYARSGRPGSCVHHSFAT
jgi:hypothetical protein